MKSKRIDFFSSFLACKTESIVEKSTIFEHYLEWISFDINRHSIGFVISDS